ncbi:DUF6011 domain-containing protein [Streptomonospora litoralis]|uniref:SWIM-type domain-containing protein n=1 Tax=Streptomonospora litoralis TaxID=2498135 RepID=A0A4V0ZKF7_9ACTN|nr:DUF6011 domain-containing protein [Streptomonospora litoralis]QBI56822.1 hypothetical protein EKD16_25410 [Streptomonospora litoralis]
MATSTAHTATCRRCHRPLTSARSIRLGYGKGCWAEIRAEKATLEGYKDHQIASATEAIEDGALVHYRDGIHLVVSADGTRTHRATAHHCTCQAGVRGTRCWHTAAVQILTAARLAPTAPARTFTLAA